MAYATQLDPASPVELNSISTTARDGLKRTDGERAFAALAAELGELQELLYAAAVDALLVVLQGMDTSGKDGTIRGVFRDVDPQGVRVTGFKVPTADELAHDFLWRVHRHTPERGMMAVFNRSHYEDVLVVRVKQLVPEPVWRQRYDQINDFERLLTSTNTIVAKFFLHISKEEQEERLREREEDVEKAWKLSAGDWLERRRWDDYQAAYADALTLCNTEYAPWYVVPADDKWFRNLAVAETLVKLLRPRQDDWLARLRERGATELAAITEARDAPQGN